MKFEKIKSEKAIRYIQGQYTQILAKIGSGNKKKEKSNWTSQESMNVLHPLFSVKMSKKFIELND